MIDPQDPAQLQDAARAAEVALEEEKKQAGLTGGDVADIGANVMAEGVGEVIASALGTAAETALAATGSIIEGIVEGIAGAL